MPGATSPADATAALDAIRRERVGGAFWSLEEDPWSRAGTGAEARSIDWLAGRPVEDAATVRAATIARLSAVAYRDPFTGAPASIGATVALLGQWRRRIENVRGIVAQVGMAAWKQQAMAQFLWDGSGSPPFISATAAVARAGPGRAIAAWPSRVPASLAGDIAARDGALWFVEDGFLRSTGLGAECRPPASILVDRLGGLHFDPEQPSEVETILAETAFDAAILARAGALRERLVAGRLGKYGVFPDADLPDLPRGRRVVLAVGQVADDLSVLRAGGGATGARDFLANVRRHEPDAFIIHRPHPDVAAGLRRGDDAAAVADLTIATGSLARLFDRVDAVHVLSSLTGFEALLRGVEVVVHGRPFYAGWGLTRDLSVQPDRRRRRLSLDELVAGALIIAPLYRDPVTGLPCEVEHLVSRMLADPIPEQTWLTTMRRAIGATRRTFVTRGAWA